MLGHFSNTPLALGYELGKLDVDRETRSNRMSHRTHDD